MMSDAPERIIALANRQGAAWKMKPPDSWFGEAFDGVEYIRADLAGLPEDLVARLKWLVETPYYPGTQRVSVPLLRDILAWHERQKGGWK